MATKGCLEAASQTEEGLLSTDSYEVSWEKEKLKWEKRRERLLVFIPWKSALWMVIFACLSFLGFLFFMIHEGPLNIKPFTCEYSCSGG